MSSADQIEIRGATAANRDFVLGLVPRLRAFGPPPLRPPEALDEAEAGNSRALTVYERAGYAQDTIRYLKTL